MKKILLALLLVGGLSAAAKDVCTEGDALPWPWGTECPFPWENIEGNWQVSNDETGDTFSFQILKVDKVGRRTFEIKRYDVDNVLIAQGKGVATKRRKILRAFLSSIHEPKKKNYWALIRAYNEVEGFSCDANHMAVVITLRTTRPKTCEKDAHFVIRKDSESQETQDTL